MLNMLSCSLGSCRSSNRIGRVVFIVYFAPLGPVLILFRTCALSDKLTTFLGGSIFLWRNFSILYKSTGVLFYGRGLCCLETGFSTYFPDYLSSTPLNLGGTLRISVPSPLNSFATTVRTPYLVQKCELIHSQAGIF